MTKVSFIIVTFNSEHYIADCLHSIENLSYANREIIIVDNSSSDHTVQILESTFCNVTLIKSDINLGFAEGCNTGYQHTTGNLIALVNPDIVLDNDWLSHLLTYATDPQYVQTGIFASKIINVNNALFVIDTAGDGYSSFLKSFKRGEGENVGEFNTNEFVFGACAGAALYRRKMIDDIGFFDTDFFLLQEDSDLNVRAQLAGWKTFYVPKAIAYHKVRSSIDTMSDTAVYYSLRNIEFARIKNVPFGIFMRFLPEFILGTITDFIYYVLKHKKFRLYAKSKIDSLKMLPKMYKKRKLIMEKKKVTNRYIASLMTSVWQKSFLKARAQRFING